MESFYMNELDQRVLRMQDSATEEMNEKRERLYNQLYPEIDEVSKAVQLVMRLEN
jgi:hypothetical protein